MSALEDCGEEGKGSQMLTGAKMPPPTHITIIPFTQGHSLPIGGSYLLAQEAVSMNVDDKLNNFKGK